MEREETSRVLAEWIAASRALVAFSGAGLSTESGLPDFRSRKGLWERYDPGELATEEALWRRYDRFREFYSLRLGSLQDAEPNEGHRVLAAWEREGILRGVVTQNVDGLHQAAGSREVAELHGRLESVRCASCGRGASPGAFREGIPCGVCGGRLRPGVVLFGESLPEAAWDRAEALTEEADLFLVLGSSLQVAPANLLPRRAAARGAKLVILNGEPTPLDWLADRVLRGGLGENLGDLRRRVGELRG